MDEKNNEMEKNIVIRNILIGITVFIFIIIVALYVSSPKVRSFIDKNILRRELTENNVTSININFDNNAYATAYDKYIAVLNKSTLEAYSVSGKKEFDLEINVSNPLFYNNNRFLAIAENEGQKAYLVSSSNIVWQKDVEGKISKINVNQNGYVSLVLTQTSHKNVIVTYNPQGEEIATTFLASTYAIDIDISNDNKYLAIAEINTNGTLIQSNIKIISLEKAKNNPSEAIIFYSEKQMDRIITDIKYNSKDVLTCMYNDGVENIINGKVQNEVSFDENTLFSDIRLNDNILTVKKENSGVFSSKISLNIKSIVNETESIYAIDAIPKSIYAYNETIAVNVGQEVYFVNSLGWLLKKYTSNQDIKNIILTGNIAGIIYNNKIEIINL